MARRNSVQSRAGGASGGLTRAVEGAAIDPWGAPDGARRVGDVAPSSREAARAPGGSRRVQAAPSPGGAQRAHARRRQAAMARQTWRQVADGFRSRYPKLA